MEQCGKYRHAIALAAPTATPEYVPRSLNYLVKNLFIRRLLFRLEGHLGRCRPCRSSPFDDAREQIDKLKSGWDLIVTIAVQDLWKTCLKGSAQNSQTVHLEDVVPGRIAAGERTKEAHPCQAFARSARPSSSPSYRRPVQTHAVSNPAEERDNRFGQVELRCKPATNLPDPSHSCTQK